MKYLGTKELKTERLTLRKVRVEDAPNAYNNWCNSDEVSKFVLWDKHNNVQETIDLYNKWVDEYKDDMTFNWIVELNDTKEVIGTITGFKKHLKYGVCEIGYCYGDKYWNRGYATEALKRVIKFLFEECEADLIYAEFMENNPASGEVMKKSGMIYDGKLRGRVVDKAGIRNDLLNYSITRDEYFKNIK